MLSRTRMAGLLLVGTITAAACSDTPPNVFAPQQAQMSHTPSAACDAGIATEIEAQINATFTKNNFKNDAQKQFAKIKTACSTNNAQAVALAVSLVDFARKHYPTNTSSAANVTRLWNLLQLYVTPSDYSPIDPTALTEGGAGVCGSAGCTILGAANTAGLYVPNGAVSASHLFAFWRASCFNVTDSHVDPQGPCFQFEVWPTTTFNPDVVAAVCSAESTPAAVKSRGLIGQFHANQFKVTPRGVLSPFATLDCSNATFSNADVSFGQRMFARLADLLSPDNAYATHPTSTGSVRTFSVLGLIDPLIFFGDFNRFAIGTLPSGSLDSVGTWNTYTVAHGSIQVVASVGDLANQPVKLDAAGGNASGGTGVRLEVIVKNPTPAPPGIYAVTWRSLAASPNVDSAFISLRTIGPVGSESAGSLIARVQYTRGQAAQSGTLHFVSAGGTSQIGTWNINVNQKFDLVVNFYTGQVAVSINGQSVGSFGFTTAAPGNLYSINFELLGRDVHTLGADDVRIDRLPDYEAVTAP